MKFSAQNLLNTAVEKYCDKGEEIDYSKLARVCELSYSNVYAPIKRGRSPNAEIWLKIMKGLGAVEETKKGWLIRKV